jgi:hypothetical protein
LAAVRHSNITSQAFLAILAKNKAANLSACGVMFIQFFKIMAKINESKPSGYALSRAWFDFAFENQGMVSGNHGCMFLWFLEKNNRMGWVKHFGAPRDETMAAVGITSYNTYRKIFSDLVEWGFIKVIKESKNQYTAHIIALSKNDQPSIQALDSALIQATIQHEYSHCSDTDTGTNTDTVAINKQETLNNKPETIKHVGGNKKFIPPSHTEVQEFFESKTNETFWTADQCKFQAERFVNFYESKNWMVGKTKMAKWKSAASGWVNRSIEDQKQKTTGQPQKGFQAAMDMYNKLKL